MALAGKEVVNEESWNKTDGLNRKRGLYRMAQQNATNVFLWHGHKPINTPLSEHGMLKIIYPCASPDNARNAQNRATATLGHIYADKRYD